MTTAPPRPDADTHPPEDEFRLGGFSWFTIGVLGGLMVTSALAFLMLMGRTGTPEYTVEMVRERAGAAGAAADSLTLIGTEFAYDPVDTAIIAGGELTLDNQGSIEHNVVLEGVANIEILAAPNAQASAVIEVAPGTYTIFCSIPGHRDAGMEGTLTVVEAE